MELELQHRVQFGLLTLKSGLALWYRAKIFGQLNRAAPATPPQSRLAMSPDGNALAVKTAKEKHHFGDVELWKAPSLAEIDAVEKANAEM